MKASPTPGSAALPSPAECLLGRRTQQPLRTSYPPRLGRGVGAEGPPALTSSSHASPRPLSGQAYPALRRSAARGKKRRTLTAHEGLDVSVGGIVRRLLACPAAPRPAPGDQWQTAVYSGRPGTTKSCSSCTTTIISRGLLLCRILRSLLSSSQWPPRSRRFPPITARDAASVDQ